MPAVHSTSRDPRCDHLERAPTYQEFLERYLIPNRPVVIGPALVSSWPAFRDWILPANKEVLGDKFEHDCCSRIDWDYLAREYGDCEVTVADCSTREFSDQRRETMRLRDVIALWRNGTGSSLYVKDWHLAREHPHPLFYATLDIFRDDWMNAYYAVCTADDFRFVYAGAARTFTPLHRDVYASYSWSTNIAGRKRWWLFPPEQTPLLVRKNGAGETAYDVRCADEREFPGVAQARPVVLEQEEGETIFVPSGWYHQVENLTECISINHNWCNATNLPALYASMCAKVTEVERALEDVRELLSKHDSTLPSEGGWQREWVHVVQDLVEKDAGWHWATFWRMVLHALRCAVAPKQAPTSELWAPAPPELMPPVNFVKERIKQCLDDFVKRDQREVELVPGLNNVVASINQLLGSG
ncbi:hypothetical protein CERSUDRAFT_118711 [Gelatoporia subvermispora B]|uniref:JmjC domain-containing protein n=1 Tax=Ceriporiopsis subvermispora (strain B) TaxID=914234 RepID=M2Q677_CERS8|nr:hypothetical protein CERSUDRAFT_118711 [Gelatoporia subvermispora B]